MCYFCRSSCLPSSPYPSCLKQKPIVWFDIYKPVRAQPRQLETTDTLTQACTCSFTCVEKWIQTVNPCSCCGVRFLNFVFPFHMFNLTWMPYTVFAHGSYISCVLACLAFILAQLVPFLCGRNLEFTAQTSDSWIALTPFATFPLCGTYLNLPLPVTTLVNIPNELTL